MNLYDQLLSLQVIENAYEEWRIYRKEVTDYILKEASGSETIAILGAGRCNDIDLERLVTHFKEVTLIDKDQSAMEMGIYKQQVRHADRIKTKQVDFIGMQDEDYRDYADTLIHEVRKLGQHTHCKQLAEVALKELIGIEEKIKKTPVDLGKDTYEMTVVLGVHSQLFSMLEWIWHIMLQTIKQDEVSVRKYIIEMNERYIKQFNQQVIRATKEMMIIGCEKQRVGKVGGIQGAMQALMDLEQRMLQGEIVKHSELKLIWPFNKAQEIVYLVEFFSLKINEI